MIGVDLWRQFLGLLKGVNSGILDSNTASDSTREENEDIKPLWQNSRAVVDKSVDMETKLEDSGGIIPGFAMHFVRRSRRLRVFRAQGKRGRMFPTIRRSRSRHS
jgi:hypothetical protein